jgi:hypothetical protein
MPPEIEDEFKFPDEKPEIEVDAEELKIEIEDDTPEEDRGKKAAKRPPQEVTDEELEQYSKSAKQRIQRFTRGYHDERRAKEEALREREAAETYARQLYEENQRLQKQLATGSKAFIEQSKTAAEAKLLAAEEKYRKAYESADTEAIISAQKEIAKATIEAEQAERLRPIEEPEERQYQPPAAAQPQTSALQERTQKWVDSNKDWFGKDEKMTQTAMALDRRLKRMYGEDYLGTAHYFKVIDQSMRKQFPGYFGSEENEAPLKKTSKPARKVAKAQVEVETQVETDTKPAVRAKKPAVVVAPATRSTPSNRVRLKASEVALAKRLGVPLELYAKQKAAQQRSE